MIDIHCHLYSDEATSQFKNISVLATNVALVPQAWVVNSTRVEDWPLVAAFVANLPKNAHSLTKSGFGIGIHPWYINDYQKLNDSMVAAWAKHPQCFTLGEIGLDKLRPNFPLQKTILRQFLTWNEDWNLPVSLHCVKAWDDLRSILQDFPHFHYVLHGYQGDWSLANSFKSLNMYYGLGLNWNPAKTRQPGFWEFLKKCPQERILLETDASMMSATPTTPLCYVNDSQTAVLSNIKANLQILADTMDLSAQELVEQCDKNAHYFLKFVENLG
jgi:TatD DNase family protein